MARDLGSEGLELKIGGMCEKHELEKDDIEGKFVVAKKEDGFYFFFEPKLMAHADLAQEYGLTATYLGEAAAPWEGIVGGGDVYVCGGRLFVGRKSGSYGSIPLEMAKEYALKVKEYLFGKEVEITTVEVQVTSDLKPIWKEYLGEGYFKLIEGEEQKMKELEEEMERIRSGESRGLLYEEILK
ncbi:MAG: hypothetical protein WCV90_05590 [Candidatus Woesearchaeota archaeon]|jgi:hypothetical protein